MINDLPTTNEQEHTITPHTYYKKKFPIQLQNSNLNNEKSQQDTQKKSPLVIINKMKKINLQKILI